jgi:hypothetical protein
VKSASGVAKLLKAKSGQVSTKRLLSKIALEPLQRKNHRMVELLSSNFDSRWPPIAGVLDRSSRRKLYRIPKRFHRKRSDRRIPKLPLPLNLCRFPIMPLLVSFGISVLSLEYYFTLSVAAFLLPFTIALSPLPALKDELSSIAEHASDSRPDQSRKQRAGKNALHQIRKRTECLNRKSTLKIRAHPQGSVPTCPGPCPNGLPPSDNAASPASPARLARRDKVAIHTCASSISEPLPRSTHICLALERTWIRGNEAAVVEEVRSVENQTITLELWDETAKICGGIVAIQGGACHFAPRGMPGSEVLFFPYRDGRRVSAVLKLIPADYCVVFDDDPRYARAVVRSWGNEFPDPIVGEPFYGSGGWLIPVVNGEPIRYGAVLSRAVDKDCSFLVRRRREPAQRVVG